MIATTDIGQPQSTAGLTGLPRSLLKGKIPRGLELSFHRSLLQSPESFNGQPPVNDSVRTQLTFRACGDGFATPSRKGFAFATHLLDARPRVTEKNAMKFPTLRPLTTSASPSMGHLHSDCFAVTQDATQCGDLNVHGETTERIWSKRVQLMNELPGRSTNQTIEENVAQLEWSRATLSNCPLF